jgi:hypothetical protein
MRMAKLQARRAAGVVPGSIYLPSVAAPPTSGPDDLKGQQSNKAVISDDSDSSGEEEAPRPVTFSLPIRASHLNLPFALLTKGEVLLRDAPVVIRGTSSSNSSRPVPHQQTISSRASSKGEFPEALAPTPTATSYGRALSEGGPDAGSLPSLFGGSTDRAAGKDVATGSSTVGETEPEGPLLTNELYVGAGGKLYVQWEAVARKQQRLAFPTLPTPTTATSAPANSNDYLFAYPSHSALLWEWLNGPSEETTAFALAKMTADAALASPPAASSLSGGGGLSSTTTGFLHKGQQIKQQMKLQEQKKTLLLERKMRLSSDNGGCIGIYAWSANIDVLLAYAMMAAMPANNNAAYPGSIPTAALASTSNNRTPTAANGSSKRRKRASMELLASAVGKALGRGPGVGSSSSNTKRVNGDASPGSSSSTTTSAHSPLTGGSPIILTTRTSSASATVQPPSSSSSSSSIAASFPPLQLPAQAWDQPPLPPLGFHDEVGLRADGGGGSTVSGSGDDEHSSIASGSATGSLVISAGRTRSEPPAMVSSKTGKLISRSPVFPPPLPLPRAAPFGLPPSDGGAGAGIISPPPRSSSESNALQLQQVAPTTKGSSRTAPAVAGGSPILAPKTHSLSSGLSLILRPAAAAGYANRSTAVASARLAAEEEKHQSNTSKPPRRPFAFPFGSPKSTGATANTTPEQRTPMMPMSGTATPTAGASHPLFLVCDADSTADMTLQLLIGKPMLPPLRAPFQPWRSSDHNHQRPSASLLQAAAGGSTRGLVLQNRVFSFPIATVSSWVSSWREEEQQARRTAAARERGGFVDGGGSFVSFDERDAANDRYQPAFALSTAAMMAAFAEHLSQASTRAAADADAEDERGIPPAASSQLHPSSRAIAQTSVQVTPLADPARLWSRAFPLLLLNAHCAGCETVIAAKSGVIALEIGLLAHGNRVAMAREGRIAKALGSLEPSSAARLGAFFSALAPAFASSIQASPSSSPTAVAATSRAWPSPPSIRRLVAYAVESYLLSRDGHPESHTHRYYR